jgi:hypothetical protein
MSETFTGLDSILAIVSGGAFLISSLINIGNYMQFRLVKNSKAVTIQELFEKPEAYEGIYCTVRGLVSSKNSFPSKTLPEMAVVYSKYNV